MPPFKPAQRKRCCMSEPLNRFSRRITQEKSQGASQAMLYGTGLTEEDMDKPQVGIASVWYEGNTCNMHLNELAAEVKEGVVEAGMVGMYKFAARDFFGDTKIALEMLKRGKLKFLPDRIKGRREVRAMFDKKRKG